jgi:hypothetical protein
MKKMKKYELTICIIGLLFFSILSPMVFSLELNENNKTIDNLFISDVTVTPGVTACIIEFSTADVMDTIKIYYSESSPVTLSDKNTYIDPIDCNKDYRINRKMFFGPLKEDTIYFYRIFNTRTSSWISVEGSFKTGLRFNEKTGWSDHFFDTYLIDNSNYIEIAQQIGIKDVDNPFFWDDRDISSPPGARIGWTGQVTNSNDPVRWDGWFINRSDGTNGHYYTSENGKDWTKHNEAQSKPLYYIKKYNENNGKWWTMARPSMGKGDVYVGDSINGSFELVKQGALDRDNVDGNECTHRGMINDTLRCNILLITGQCNALDPKIRLISQFVGLNQTDWLHWDNAFRYMISAPAGEGGEQHYFFNGQIEAGCYVFFLSYWHDDDSIDVYLLISRNGWDWTYVDPSLPIIPLGSSGSWEDGMTLDATYDRIIDGEYDYRYYWGCDGTHYASERKIGVGRIQFRRDGLTAIKPLSDNAWFLTVNIPEIFRYDFRINGNFNEGAKLNIIVMNATTGDVYPGFDLDDSDAITDNDFNIMPTWGDGSRILSDIPRGDFKLLFKWTGMDGGELYSYDISGVMDFDPPSTPDIDGPTNGKVGTNYNYTFNSISPEGNDVYYFVDWGDGKVDDWFGPYNSGEDATASHKWTKIGAYTIKARAKDTNDIMGPWGSFDVTIPRNKLLSRPILNFLHSHPKLFQHYKNYYFF